MKEAASITAIGGRFIRGELGEPPVVGGTVRPPASHNSEGHRRIALRAQTLQGTFSACLALDRIPYGLEQDLLRHRLFQVGLHSHDVSAVPDRTVAAPSHQNDRKLECGALRRL